MIDLNEVERQARAEVLAAFIKEVEYEIHYCKRALAEDHPKGTCAAHHRGEIAVAERLAKRTQELQPAASALEELLRREQLLEACWWMGNCVEPWEPSAKAKELAENRITELDKARASKEKG